MKLHIVVGRAPPRIAIPTVSSGRWSLSDNAKFWDALGAKRIFVNSTFWDNFWKRRRTKFQPPLWLESHHQYSTLLKPLTTYQLSARQRREEREREVAWHLESKSHCQWAQQN